MYTKFSSFIRSFISLSSFFFFFFHQKLTCSVSGRFLGLVASISFTSALRFLEYWLDTEGNFPLMILPARPLRLNSNGTDINKTIDGDGDG